MIVDETGEVHKSSRSLFFKIGAFKNFMKLTEKHLCWSFLFNLVTGLRASNFIIIIFFIRVFSCEYCKIFKNSFSLEHLRWLLLGTAINQRYSEK